MDQPTVIAAAISAVVAIITVLANGYYNKRKLVVDQSKTDRELLSADERSFRQSIIDELHRLRAANEECENRSLQLHRENLRQQTEIDTLKSTVKSLQSQLDSNTRSK